MKKRATTERARASATIADYSVCWAESVHYWILLGVPVRAPLMQL